MGMNRRELARRVAERTGIPVQQARKFTSALIDELEDAIMEKQHVELRGFGVFDLTWRASRRAGANLPGQEGEGTREIAGRWTVTFQPAAAVVQRLREEFEPGE